MAAEYRLQVANLHDSSFSHFLRGKIGRGEGELVMDRLERALDGGVVVRGAFLHRPFQAARESLADAFRASRVRGDVTPGEEPRLWDEAVWEGAPGERSLWVKLVVGWDRRRSADISNLEGRWP